MRIDGQRRGSRFGANVVQTLAVLAAVLLVFATAIVPGGPLDSVRDDMFHLYQRLWPVQRATHGGVAIVVDDESLRRVGQWPWPRDVLARLVAGAGQARAVGIDLLMPEPDRLSPEHLLDGRGAVDAALRQALAALPRPDAILAETLRQVPAVLAVSAGEPVGGAHAPVPFTPVRLAGQSVATELIHADAVSWPLPELAAASQGIGVVSAPGQAVGETVALPGAVAVSGSVLPSFAVELVRVALGARAVVIRSDLLRGRSLEIGPLTRAVDRSGTIRPHFDRDDVPVIPAYRLLENGQERTTLVGKVVVIGVTATGIGERFATPLRTAEPGALLQAELVDDLLSGDVLERPLWARSVEWIAGLMAGIGAGLLLGRIGYRLHAVLSGFAVLLMLGGSMFAFAGHNLLLDPSLPIAALLAAIFVALMVRTAVEVTERRRQEQALSIALVERNAAERELALRNEAGQLRQSLGFAVEAAQLGTWDADLIKQTWHHSARYDALLGFTVPLPAWSREAILAQVVPEDRALVTAGLVAGEKQESFAIECRIGTPDGSPRHVRMSGRFWKDASGKPVRVAGVVADVTQQRELEQRLHNAEKSRTIGLLAAGVAHNFNNLLTVVMGNLDLAQRRVAADDATGTLLAGATRAAERGAGIARQLLAFARLQPLAPQPLDPAEQLRDVTGLLRNAMPNGIRVTLETEAELGHIKVDPVELELALINLVLNARDAMPDGGAIDIHARARFIRDSRLGLDGRFVVIEVADTGAGIEPAALPAVFDPFFTTKEIGKGTGLGLSQVHGFAHQSGGAVDIESLVGRGTRVRLYLPSLESAPLSGSQEKKEGLPWGQPRGNGHAPVSAWFLL